MSETAVAIPDEPADDGIEKAEAEYVGRPVDVPVPDKPPIVRLPCCPRPFMSMELKSMCPDRVQVITETDVCQRIVPRLLKEKVIGLAMEGINVGKEGPITLLQVGLCSGNVFVFDVLVNRDLVIKGRLKQLLEDTNVVKVVHDCSAMSAALEFQFATTLTNVHDTQVAHLLISKHQGRRLPVQVTLSELVLKYAANPERLCMYDWRTDAKEMWMSMLGNFWAARPMTTDMVEYAACDVVVLIPDVYRTQSDYIEKNKLFPLFMREVEVWLQLDTDVTIKEKHGKKVSQEVIDVLIDMDCRYDDRTKLFNILDEDEINALSLVTYEDAGAVSPRIQRLKTTMILRELDGIDVTLRTDLERWQQHRGNILDYLRYYQRLSHEEIHNRATEILDHVITSVLEHIEGKYHITTTPNMLTVCEKDCILTIPYNDVMSGKAGTVTTHMFWNLMLEEIHGMINCLRFSPHQFGLTEHEYQKVTCFAADTTGSVPEEVATMAMGLVHSLRAFSASTASYSIQEKRRNSSKI